MKYVKPEMELINLVARESVITESVYVEDETILDPDVIIKPPTGGF